MGNETLQISRRDVRAVAVVAITVGVLLLGLLVAAMSVMETQWRQVQKDASAVVVAPEALRMKVRSEIHERFLQGVQMLSMKEYEHALTAFHRVLQLDPAMPDAHVNAGYALMGLGRPELARSFFEAATELNKDQLNAYWGLALSLEAGGELEKAVGAMRVYAHLSSDDDPFRRRAWAALWEWENRLKEQRAAEPASR